MSGEFPQQSHNEPTAENNANDALETQSLKEAVQSVLEHHNGLCLDDENDRHLLGELIEQVFAERLAKSSHRESRLNVAETVNEADEPIPTNWVAKDDLVYCRPELAEQIQALAASEVQHIASKIGDALQETYWLAMGIVLDKYFGNEDTQRTIIR